jgi:hypothetical protein
MTREGRGTIRQWIRRLPADAHVDPLSQKKGFVLLALRSDSAKGFYLQASTELSTMCSLVAKLLSPL